MKIYSTLKRPVVTEKSTQLNSKGIYTFFVPKDTTKIEVKKSIETLYATEVEKVRIVMTKKKCRLGKNKHEILKRPSEKKAIVTLKSGKQLDINKIAETKK